MSTSIFKQKSVENILDLQLDGIISALFEVRRMDSAIHRFIPVPSNRDTKVFQIAVLKCLDCYFFLQGIRSPVLAGTSYACHEKNGKSRKLT